MSNPNQPIVVVAGTLSSGKGTFAKHLACDHDFKHIPYGDVLRVEATRQGRDHERTTLLDIAAAIRRREGLEGLASLAVKQWNEVSRDYYGLAVDGPRAIGDATGWLAYGARIAFVDAPIELRYIWMVERKRDAEAILTFEEFVANDRREWEGDGSPEGPNLRGVKEYAEITANNTGTKADLINQLDGWLGYNH